MLGGMGDLEAAKKKIEDEMGEKAPASSPFSHAVVAQSEQWRSAFAWSLQISKSK